MPYPWHRLEVSLRWGLRRDCRGAEAWAISGILGGISRRASRYRADRRGADRGDRRDGPAWAVEPTIEAFQDRWPRWRQLTSTAAHRGMLCFGPDRARHVTYTSPHRWLPGFRPAAGSAALRTLLARYLYAYGPATPAHFARWLGISPRHAAGLFGQLPASWTACRWRANGDGPQPATPEPRPWPHRGIRLLPYFDAYVVAGLSPGTGCTRAQRPPARSPRRARPGTTRYSSSTASSAGYGTSGARAARSPSPWNRWLVRARGVRNAGSPWNRPEGQDLVAGRSSERGPCRARADAI